MENQYTPTYPSREFHSSEGVKSSRLKKLAIMIGITASLALCTGGVLLAIPAIAHMSALAVPAVIAVVAGLFGAAALHNSYRH